MCVGGWRRAESLKSEVWAEGVTRRMTGQLEFRDPVRAKALADALVRTKAQVGRVPVSVMHVCGSHEQAIAKFGLRAVFPRGLNVIMGPGCPVCITDQPEVAEAVALAQAGVRIATYGDMLRVPGPSGSLADTGLRERYCLVDLG